MSAQAVRRTLVFAFALSFGAAFAVQQVQAQAAKTVVLKGSPMGGVKFEHTLHTKDRNIKCDTCHHASKPEKAKTSDYQKCTDCHTKVATAPMKTKTQAAFHDPMAKKGVCVDCHLAENAKGKKAPTSKCADCHKKEHV